MSQDIVDTVGVSVGAMGHLLLLLLLLLKLLLLLLLPRRSAALATVLRHPWVPGGRQYLVTDTYY